MRKKEKIQELKKECVIEGSYCFGKWSSKRPRCSHRSHHQEEAEERGAGRTGLTDGSMRHGQIQSPSDAGPNSVSS